MNFDEIKEKRFNELFEILEEYNLNDDEIRYLKWLCSWDNETYTTFKNLFIKTIKKR